MNANGNIIWKAMWMTLIREIWHHRNYVMFRDATVDREKFWNCKKSGMDKK